MYCKMPIHLRIERFFQFVKLFPNTFHIENSLQTKQLIRHLRDFSNEKF